MTALEMFLGCFALTAGLGLGAVVVFVAGMLLYRLHDIINAWSRYAVRREIVVEEYFHDTMVNRRMFHEPKPDRVFLAKKGKAA